MEEDIYKDVKSAVEATEKAKRYNDDRTGLERLNYLIRKQVIFGDIEKDVDDKLKSEIRDKLIEEVKNEIKKEGDN